MKDGLNTIVMGKHLASLLTKAVKTHLITKEIKHRTVSPNGKYGLITLLSFKRKYLILAFLQRVSP